MVITDLKEKLDNEFQKYFNIVLVNGPWGIGKTYYLKDYLLDKDSIYISLFGISNLESLKCTIYYELNKKGAYFNKFSKNISNRDISVLSVSVPIPNISLDFEKK